MLDPLDTPPKQLFWAAHPAFDLDFTAEDPLAMDYLAQQVGLWLFPGFTTRTNRAQYYAVVLYGLHLAEKAIQQYGYLGDDITRTRLFERWERFWALATLEFRNGRIERGDEDAMRGIRGATRAWFSGSNPLPLDFPLISRQSELGALGAYLTSLRGYGLVFPNSLQVSPAGREIINSFWSEPGARELRHLYEEYSLHALDFDVATIARSSRRLTLAGLGQRSRLSSLIALGRQPQQDRLWNALFLSARDGSTLQLAKCLMEAHANNIDEPETLLEGVASRRYGDISANTAGKVDLALAFGRIARVLLQRFDCAYGFVEKCGWVADFSAVATASFPINEAKPLRSLCVSVTSANDARRLMRLPVHGPQFLNLLRHLSSSGPQDSLEHLLLFHRQVQRTRRGCGTWLRKDHEKLVMQLANYRGYQSKATFPAFKLDAVRQLLIDLGRLK